MYISVEQSLELDKIVKSNEVAFRSFVADILSRQYSDFNSFKVALESISISDELIYSRRFTAKLKGFIQNAEGTYSVIEKCKKSLDNGEFNNDVPYVSEIIELLLIFFNAHFSNKDIVKDFSSIEEFHYCCTLYHSTRNNLSHPASRPIKIIDANKVVYFIENIVSGLDDKYFWYYTRNNIKLDIKKYNVIDIGKNPKYHNLSFASSSHKRLLCRETVIKQLYDSLMGDEQRQRLAGSIVLYGYGGVGKTAITTEFLYRVARDKLDGKYGDVEYLLFFSSKDEYLRDNKSTGQLYIDVVKPEFSNLDELITLITDSLEIKDVKDITTSFKKGIIVIDNIENIEQKEKTRILDFIKSLPRTVQFIVTSRNEEACEEKIHVEEFKNDTFGLTFVNELIESEGFNLDIDEAKAGAILKSSKGNALIILQIFNVLERGVSTFNEITSSLDSMKSKNSEMIANFMYKNTFDSALKYLESTGYPVNDVMQIISLYDERIELYSISKLANIDISEAENGCNYLLERLVLKKVGEYYELNEFAKRFVFIKLLPDRVELAKVKQRIKLHKERMKVKLKELDDALDNNSVLHQKVNEWQPRNYIDRIVIAELFSLYGEAIVCVGKRNKAGYEKYLKDFEEHSFVTNHPYVPLQKARLLKEGHKRFYRGNKAILDQVELSFEEAIESVEYEYRYLIGSVGHGSLLMLFGVFLCQQLKQYSRSIRYLEDAKLYHNANKNKGWFVICNYLTIAYEGRYNETYDRTYLDQLKKLSREIIANQKSAEKNNFDIPRYIDKFSKLINE